MADIEAEWQTQRARGNHRHRHKRLEVSGSAGNQVERSLNASEASGGSLTTDIVEAQREADTDIDIDIDTDTDTDRGRKRGRHRHRHRHRHSKGTKRDRRGVSHHVCAVGASHWPSTVKDQPWPARPLSVRRC